jgi:hypothetical protein
MLRVRDWRGGDEREVSPGELVSYPDGDWWRLVRVIDRLVRAWAIVEGPHGIARLPLRIRFRRWRRVGYMPVYVKLGPAARSKREQGTP